MLSTGLLLAFTAATMAVDCEDRLLPSGGQPGSFFGQSTAFSADGRRLVVGAHGHNVGPLFSAVFVYRWDGAWVEEALLTEDTDHLPTLDTLGWSVAVSADGSTIIAGAPDLYGGSQTGSAGIFVRDGTSWSVQAELVPSGHSTFWDRFGISVAISEDGNTIAAGAPREDLDDGVAYVFVRDGTTWTEQVRLPAPDVPDAQFGSFVALSGDGNALLVGAPYAAGGGKAYLFERMGANWGEPTTLAPDDNGGWFGTSVAITPDAGTALIGAASGDTGGLDTGTAYVFERIGGVWAQQIEIGPTGESLVYFGAKVAMSADADWLLASAPLDDDVGLNAGAAYVFRRDGDTWIRDTKLIACQTGGYGQSVAIVPDGKTIAVGADDDGASGVTAGAVYLYETAALCPDCDDNGFLDHCDLEYGTRQDCNGNTVPDNCDVADGGSPDANANGLPDECEPIPCLESTVVLTQNQSHELELGGVSCVQGGITQTEGFARSYDLSASPETAGWVFLVRCVEVGVYNEDLETTARVTIYVDTDGGDPVAPGVDLAMAGQTERQVPAPTLNALFSVGFDPPVVIPPDSTVVAELGYLEGVETFGGYASNDSPATGPTWIRAPACAVPVYRTAADLGFPGRQLIQRVRGDTVEFVAGDINADGVVNEIDMATLLRTWGPCAAPPNLCPADFNGDGVVGINDFLLLLANWG